jgi:hypothetical protein
MTRQREPNISIGEMTKRLKLAGYSVARSKTGGFNVSKPGGSLHFGDVESLQEFSAKVAPKKGLS